MRPSVQLPDVSGVDIKLHLRISRHYASHFLEILTSGQLDLSPFKLKIGTPITAAQQCAVLHKSAVLKKFVQFYSVKCAVGKWTIYMYL